MNEILARVPKTEHAELRVTRSEWKGRCIVDFRLWYLPDGNAEWVPSGKGCAIDASKFPELLRQLQPIDCEVVGDPHA